MNEGRIQTGWRTANAGSRLKPPITQEGTVWKASLPAVLRENPPSVSGCPIYRIQQTAAPSGLEPTGWARVDRNVTEVRKRLDAATTEEQFQAVGLLCRETLISLAQAVYDAQLHPTQDGVAPSETDAKRMLEAYIAVAFGGSAYEHFRKHARAAYDLAAHLQHRRTASFRHAAACAEATTSIVNLIAIMAGLRDPMPSE
jgi:hypothetical protein